MNLEQLKTFATAAETLNFTQAARTLHLSQPAVSQQMRDLETSLGVMLFERRRKTLTLTVAGERLRSLTGDVLRSLTRIEGELAEFQGASLGVLNVGADSTPGIYLLPHALGAYSRQYPGVRVSLRVSDPEGLQRALRDRSLDLALLEEDLPHALLPGWKRVPLLEDELVLVVPANHALSNLSAVAFDQLVAYPFILRLPDSSIRRLLSARMVAAGHDPERLRPRFELGSTEGIKHTVLAGLGIGFVSRSAIAYELAAGLLSEVRIQGLTISRPMWLLHPAESTLPVHHQRMIDLLLAMDWMPHPIRQTLHAARSLQTLELRVTSPQVEGKALCELRLPPRCLIAMHNRNGSVSVPEGTTVLQLGDTVTLLGLPEVIAEARGMLEARPMTREGIHAHD